MSGLNSEQQRAVDILDGPLLIIAGAGSGKTRVLTYRIANLIKQKKARADEILAVTFTNKAAREMRERISKILGGRAPLWVNTFHSTCVRILRNDIEVLGYGKDFVIYDDQDQLTAIKQCFKQLNWDPNDLSPKGIQAQINKAKNRGLTVQQYIEKTISSYEDKAAKVFELYQKELKKSNAVDFGDLISLTVQIFREYPEILEKYRRQFKYCLVDEYQDTNHVQYLLIKALTEAHQNICVVGDEDQSIYSWRGADISNILSFEKDYLNAKVIKLEQNYRSTKNIIGATSHLISNNRDRKHKKLWTENEDGERIQVVQVEDEYHEARFVVGEIMRHQTEGEARLSEFAIFYRTHAQSRVLEDILRQNNIAHQIYGGIRFYGRAEVKDMMGYLKLILNPKDNVSLLRIINTPARGIGKVTIDKIGMIAQEKDVSYYEAIEILCQSQDINAGTFKKLRSFTLLFRDLSRDKDTTNIKDLYHKILDKTRYIERLKEMRTVEADTKVENLEELDSALSEYLRRNPKGTLETYLEEISLISDIDRLDESDDFVKLMTLHSAKGLEFPNVFMVGVEEGLFPHSQSEWDPAEMEEERRLCYVGMTRAEKMLYLTHANSRRFRGMSQLNLPSRFIDEIPAEFIDSVDLRRRVQRKVTLSSPGLTGGSTDDIVRDDIFDDDFNQDVKEKPFYTGMRLRHPSFGRGVVCRVEGDDEATKLTIKFDGGSIKKFLAAQTPLEKV